MVSACREAASLHCCVGAAIVVAAVCELIPHPAIAAHYQRRSRTAPQRLLAKGGARPNGGRLSLATNRAEACQHVHGSRFQPQRCTFDGRAGRGRQDT